MKLKNKLTEKQIANIIMFIGGFMLGYLLCDIIITYIF